MWIFLVTPCIALVLFGFFQSPTPIFLLDWAFESFYSLLCSLRQQLCPRSPTAALRSGRRPLTTPHSGDEPSNDLKHRERTRALVAQLGQALPVRLELRSRSKYLPDKKNSLSSSCFLCCYIWHPYYHTLNTLQLLSDTKYPPIFLTHNTSSCSF